MFIVKILKTTSPKGHIVTYIKTLTAPLIIIAGLALLTACGGAASPDTETSDDDKTGGTAVPCDTNPFGDDCGADYDAAKVTRIRECLKGNNAASIPLCAPARKVHSCIGNPFTVACGLNTDFADYIADARVQRTTFCGANPQNIAFCAESVKFNNLCRGNTDIFDTLCSTDVAGRREICEMHGITTDGNTACVDILVGPCTTDPFTNSHCESARDIGGIRDTYCGDPTTAWDDDCVESTYTGAEAARNMACLSYGIDADAGGHADCAGRDNVTEACPATAPFAYPVCDEVENINRLRTIFCRIPDNSFTAGCQTDGTHGNVNAARDRACLMDLPTATECDERAEVQRICDDNPLNAQNPGCVKLSNYRMLLSDYCAVGNRPTTVSGCGTTPAEVCPDRLFNPSVVSQTGTIDCLGGHQFRARPYRGLRH